MSATDNDASRPTHSISFDSPQLLTEHPEYLLPPPSYPALAPVPPQTLPLLDPYPHRHYVTLHPVCNKLLALKWDARQKGRLKHKIDTMKLTNFSYQDGIFLNPHPNMKKRQWDDDKKREIARNNELLVERMRHIVQNHRGVDNVRFDNRYIMRKNYRTPWKIQYEKKIQAENEALLYRISQRKPHLDRIRLLQERLTQVKYLQNISAFPQKYIELRKVLEEALGITQKSEKDYESENRVISAHAGISKEGDSASSKTPAPPATRKSQVAPRKSLVKVEKKSGSIAALPAIEPSEKLSREVSALGADGKCSTQGNVQQESYQQETAQESSQQGTVQAERENVQIEQLETTQQETVHVEQETTQQETVHVEQETTQQETVHVEQETVQIEKQETRNATADLEITQQESDQEGIVQADELDNAQELNRVFSRYTKPCVESSDCQEQNAQNDSQQQQEQKSAQEELALLEFEEIAPEQTQAEQAYSSDEFADSQAENSEPQEIAQPSEEQPTSDSTIDSNSAANPAPTGETADVTSKIAGLSREEVPKLPTKSSDQLDFTVKETAGAFADG